MENLIGGKYGREYPNPLRSKFDASICIAIQIEALEMLILGRDARQFLTEKGRTAKERCVSCGRANEACERSSPKRTENRLADQFLCWIYIFIITGVLSVLRNR